MKVLHLNSLDSGGAAKAVDRINCSLNEKINSEIFFFKDRNKFFRNFLSKPYSVADKIIKLKILHFLQTWFLFPLFLL